MSILSNLTGSGIAPTAASNIAGPVNTATSGAGTASTDAALLPLQATHYIATAANNSGVILPPGNGSGASMVVGDSMWIYNGDANTLLLYPPPLGQLNGGTATTGTVSIPTKTSVQVKMLSATLYAVSGPTT